MSSLCILTLIIIDKLFTPPMRETVRELLVSECGMNLPCINQGADWNTLLSRIRLAALKISDGQSDKLLEAVQLAQTDWRDLLMAADFGRDVHAHEVWAEQQLNDDIQK